MRIITGKAKGKKLLAVPNESTRPILDRVKTALFSIIRMEIPETKWLDLFAGCGSVGLEALSEGATHCVFVELNKQAYETIKKNAQLTNLSAQADIRFTDAYGFIKNCHQSFDFIYLDPPQQQGHWEKSLEMIAERPQLLSDGGKLIVKIHPDEASETTYNSLKEVRRERYGKSMLLFFEKAAS